MATNVIEKLLVQIESNAAQVQAELAKAGQATQRFGAQTQQVSSLAQAMGQRYSQASLAVASGVETMARAGKLGGEGLKQVIAQGANMAAFFGPQGALLGALGVASLAIVEVFRRARDEAAKLSDETKAELDTLQNRGDAVGLTERARVLFEGTPAKGFTDGIKTMRKEYEALGRTLEDLKRKGGDVQAQLAAQFGTAGAAAAKIGSSGAGALGSQFAEVKRKYDAVAAQLRAAEAEFTEIQRRVLAPGPRTPRSADPIRTTGAPPRSAADAKRTAEETTREAAAMRDLTQAFDDLFAKARAGDVSLADFDRTLRELGDGFRDKLKTPSEEQVAAFRALRVESDEVRDVLQEITAARVADEFAELRAALTPTVVDDYVVRLRKLRATLETGGFTAEMVADLLALEQALADVAIGGEQFERELARIQATAISSFDAQVALTGLLQETEEQLRQLMTSDAALAGDPAVMIQIDGLTKRVQRLREEIERAQGKTGGAGTDSASEQATLARAQRLGRAIEDIGRLTLSAADAFGVMSDEASKALAASVDVAAGVGRILLGDAKGGGAQAASGVITLLGQAFGKDPATAQRQKEHQENLAALREIARHTGDLVGIGTSGRDIAGITGAVRELLGATGNAGGFRRFGDAGPLRNINEAAFLEWRTGGIAFKEIEALAKSLGVTLNGTKQSYVDFLDALRQLDLAAYTEGFSGQLRKLELEARLDPKAFEGLDGVLQRIRVLTGPDGAPAIGEALAGLDLSTSEGRTAAIARLGDVLRHLSSLEVADLGGLSPDQFIEEILNTVDQLRALEPSFLSAGERFTAAMERIGLEVELGGLDAAGRLAKVSAAFAANFGDVFKTLDITSLESLQAGVEGIIASLTADGQLTDEERALADALRTLLEAFQANTAAIDAEAARQRERILDRAELDIRLNDVTDPVEQLRIRTAALAQAFPALAETFAQFDVTTQAGRDALEAWIRAMVGTPEALEGLATAMGITVDELLAALTGLEDGADAAAAKVASLADQLAAAFDAVDFATELEGITDPLEKLKRASQSVGAVLPEVADIFDQFDVATAEGRAGAEAALIALGKSSTDEAVQRAVLRLLNQIRGLPADSQDTLGASGSGGGGSQNLAAAATITEVTGNRLVDLFGRNVAATERIRDTLTAALASALAPLPRLTPPALPSALLPGAIAAAGGAGSTASSSIVLQLTLPQIVFQGPVTTASEDELARLIQQRFMDLVQSQLATELLVALRRAGVARAT